ncbi:MAG TPA: hypothetical protein VMR31_13940 [Myxococcota bacterium]|nr:hypothetical protein [Myxococcota bacterium]
MRVRLSAMLAGLAFAAALAAPPARASFDPAAPPAGEHTQTDGPRYWVGKVHLEYATEHPLQPPISLISGADYALGQASDGYVGARRGGKNVWFHLGDLGNPEPVPIYATGLQDLCEQIVIELGARGMMGVYVSPAPADIDAQTGGDVRAEGDTELHLVVHTGRVQAVRTFQAPSPAQPGSTAEPTNDKEDIASRSPLQPVGAGDPLDKNQLDDYIARLNRQPGRMVDAVVTPTLTPGVVNLDYLVQEDRPWTISSDFSNTGTESTGKDRQHFGFADYQLTGRDDVLLIDYLTSGFTDTNAVSGSYELRSPWFQSNQYLDRLRFRVGGNWSTYASDQFGFTTVVAQDANDPNTTTRVVRDKLHFSGTQWEVNGAVVDNLIGERGFFLDGYLGARWMDVSVVNLTSFTADMPFFVPTLGVTLDRLWPTARLHGNFGFQQSLPALAGTNSSDIEHFSDVGRANLNDDWRILSADLSGSIFLQPWFHGTRFFTDRPLRPRELVHELAWRLSGQTSLGTRLIPQVEGVLGGATTVRGYPQSIASGDSFANGSVEYRYHIPLGFESVEPWHLPWLGVFRPGPDDLLQLPDWDFVVATFLDYGKVWNEARVLGEHDDALASLGLGFEVIVRRNFSLRLDYGVALIPIPTANVSRYDGELHFAALLRY